MKTSSWKSIVKADIGTRNKLLHIVFLVIGTVALSESLVNSLDMISRGYSYSREFTAILEAQTGHGIVLKYGEFSDYREVSKKLSTIEGVEASSPFILEETLVFSKCCQQSVLVHGIIPEESKTTLEIDRYIVGGKLGTLMENGDESEEKYPGVAIGETLAKNLQVEVGSLVRLPRKTSAETREKTSSNGDAKVFRVQAILEYHYEGYDDVIAYISLADAQDLLGMEDSIVGLHIQVAEPDDPQIFASIAQELGGHFVVEEWGSLNAPVLEALDLQKSVFLWSRIPLCLAGLLSYVCCALLITLIYSGRISEHLKSGGDKRIVRRGLVIGFVPWIVVSSVVGFTLSLGKTMFASAPIPPSSDINIDNIPLTFETGISSVFSLVFLVISVAVVVGIAYYTTAVVSSREPAGTE